MCEVVFPIADNGRHIETLDKGHASLAVSIDCVVDGAFVILSEDCDVDDFHLLLVFLAAFRLSDEELVGNTDYLVCAVSVEDDDVVDVRAVRDELVLLE